MDAARRALYGAALLLEDLPMLLPESTCLCQLPFLQKENENQKARRDADSLKQRFLSSMMSIFYGCQTFSIFSAFSALAALL